MRIIFPAHDDATHLHKISPAHDDATHLHKKFTETKFVYNTFTLKIFSQFQKGAAKISHSVYMKRELELAARGLRKTSPNPMVGCVIVKEGRIIGEGWHHQYGHSHAEIEALNDAASRNEDVHGATVYVTLEPCSHYGKTPPCADRLIREGVAEVVTAMRDPNPAVNGQGLTRLQDFGVKVTELTEFEAEAKFLNRGFVFVHKYGRPFVTLKAAASLDGHMCLSNGSSKWITGIEARTQAHAIRAENDAVLVGVGTVLADDPALTVRHVEGIDPLRVVLDAKLSTPLDAKVIGTDGKCVIFTGRHADEERKSALEGVGVEVIRLPYAAGSRVDLKEVLKQLAQKGVLTLMVEGGPAVISAFLRERLGDYVKLFLSPRIFGEGREIKINAGFETVDDALRLEHMTAKQLGDDVLLEGRLTCSPAL